MDLSHIRDFPFSQHCQFLYPWQKSVMFLFVFSFATYKRWTPSVPKRTRPSSFHFRSNFCLTSSSQNRPSRRRPHHFRESARISFCNEIFRHFPSSLIKSYDSLKKIMAIEEIWCNHLMRNAYQVDTLKIYCCWMFPLIHSLQTTAAVISGASATLFV